MRRQLYPEEILREVLLDRCGRASVQRAHWERQARLLTAERFERYVTMPINASRPVWLTPERFDELMAA